MTKVTNYDIIYFYFLCHIYDAIKCYLGKQFTKFWNRTSVSLKVQPSIFLEIVFHSESHSDFVWKVNNAS